MGLGGRCDMREGGWPHARCEGKTGESAQPGQYALLCNDKLLKNVPKRICSHVMKLVVLFGRCVQFVVAWCRESLGGGGGSPLWLANDGRLSCAATSQ